MMIPERPSLERRVLAALDGAPGGPVLAFRRARRLRHRPDLAAAAVCAISSGAARLSTWMRSGSRRRPSGFSRRCAQPSPFPGPTYEHAASGEATARDAFDAALAFLDTARAPGMTPATFLLDEFLELRTFESFPGLRSVLARPRRRRSRRAATASC